MLTFRLSNDIETAVIDMPNSHRENRCKMTIFSPDGQRLGTGVGSCSTMESKYRYRNKVEPTDTQVPSAYWDHKKKNPKRAQDLIGKGNIAMKNDDGQWVIATKAGRVEYEDPADYYNTVLKVAYKRALVSGILVTTAASDIFTQDIEENPDLYSSYDSQEGEDKGNSGKTGVILIGVAEVEEIEKILSDNKIDKEKFLQAIGAATVDTIPAARVKVALGVLEKYLRKVKENKANASTGNNPGPHDNNSAGNTGGTVNNLFISDTQVADLESLISEVKANKEAFLKYFQIKALAALPNAAFKEAVGKLEQKRAQSSQGTSGGKKDVSTITEALKAKHIHFTFGKDGAILANIPFKDETSKKLVKSFGFIWDSTAGVWVLAQN
jgi:hypothetical protein